MGFEALDLYPKLHEDMRVRTVSGALVSAGAGLLMLTLLIAELTSFFRAGLVEELTVDVSRGATIQVFFNVTFPHIPCPMLSVDAVDVSGIHQTAAEHSISKRSLDKDGRALKDVSRQGLGKNLKAHEVTHQGTIDEGIASPAVAKPNPMDDPNYCGSCYGAERTEVPCCNTCEDVKAAYGKKNWGLVDLAHIEQCVLSGEAKQEIDTKVEAGEGCNINGYIAVKKAAGNIHFGPGKGFQMHSFLHDAEAISSGHFNVTHTIHAFNFGTTYPGMVSVLSGRNQVEPLEKQGAAQEKQLHGLVSLEDLLQMVFASTSRAGGTFLYYLKVVPTTYTSSRGVVINTNQYSVTEHFKPVSGNAMLPGVYFHYEISPIMVKVTEESRWSELLTHICAIIAGVATVGGCIDRWTYRVLKRLQPALA